VWRLLPRDYWDRTTRLPSMKVSIILNCFFEPVARASAHRRRKLLMAEMINVINHSSWHWERLSETTQCPPSWITVISSVWTMEERPAYVMGRTLLASSSSSIFLIGRLCYPLAVRDGEEGRPERRSLSLTSRVQSWPNWEAAFCPTMPSRSCQRMQRFSLFLMC
jgi:hypothetical protein